MFPPVERHDAVTDCDSDASDNMIDGLVHHLPRRLLNSQCVTNMLVSSVPSNSIMEEDLETESHALQNITEDPPHSSYNSSRPVRVQRKKIVVPTVIIILPMKMTQLIQNHHLSPPAKKTVIKKKASTLPRNWKKKSIYFPKNLYQII